MLMLVWLLCCNLGLLQVVFLPVAQSFVKHTQRINRHYDGIANGLDHVAGCSSSSPRYENIKISNHCGRGSSVAMRLYGSNQLSLEEVLEYAKMSSLDLKTKVTGPYLRIEAFPAGSTEIVGYLTAFIRPFPFGLFQLETIQVKNRRQNLGFERKGWTVDGPGISFIMGSYAIGWAYSRGCRRAQLLAVNDSPQMHEILKRLYGSFGFKVLREVTEDNVQERLVWGAVGTLMELDMETFFAEWRPKFTMMMELGRRRGDEQGSTPKVAKIALTREDGANGKLAELLDGCDVLELPCIQFGDGEDTDRLPTALTAHDIIVITSPQAAAVFLQAWESVGKPVGLKVATVGKGTTKPLAKAGINPIFEPSDATAETLAEELPSSLGKTVLYPSSAIAENTLAKGLEQRGFEVTRLNTYSTVPAVWSAEQTQQAQAVDIVSFGSPSAVKTWAEKAGTDYTAVVIGPTSAKAATTAGFKRVVAPGGGSKGLEAWADTIKQVASEMTVFK